MTLTFSFLNDLSNAEKSQYPNIVKRHILTNGELQEAAQILREGKLHEERFNALVEACKGRDSNTIFEAFNIREEERKQVKEELVKWFFRGKENNGVMFAKRLNKW